VDAVTEGVSVEREIAIAASPETVWELLTPEEEAVKWMGQSAEFELRPGGIYSVEVITGKWGWEPGSQSPVGPASSTVACDLTPDGDGTLLRFRHFDLPSAEAAESHGHGWDHYLGRLVRLASGGDPGRDLWLDGPMS
jgi:uncharacterized protein YndB with AHSA1/START domain